MRQEHQDRIPYTIQQGIINSENDESPAKDKKFWRYVKYQRQEAQGVAPLKKEGKLVDDPVEKANILNNQFQSVFSPPVTHCH